MVEKVKRQDPSQEVQEPIATYRVFCIYICLFFIDQPINQQPISIGY